MKGPLSKIQGLPGRERKIIFWAVMIVLALALLGFYIKNAQKRIVNINTEKTKEELQLPYLEEELKKVPKIEIPEIEMPELDQEALQELRQAVEETSTENIYHELIE